MRWSKLLGLALPAVVHSFASTDSTQDADAPQSGYLPNHNMDPNVVGTSAFALSWKNTYNALEMFYAKPLVFTPPGAANEQVIVVSNQNIVRVIDGLSGVLLYSRTLDPPFQSVDTGGCGDIPNTVGITGTPIIDTATNIMYFFSKGYKGAVVGPAGTINGQYKLYAVNLPTLTDAPGFPVIIDGNYASNDHTRYFVGGTVLNRPGLAMIGNTVIGGFGGHCDNFNYTGMLVAVSKTPGVGVTNIQAMEVSPGAPSPQTLDITVQGGGKAGIWQSGMGLAADTTNNRVFFVTGNARGAGQNKGVATSPASGSVYLSTLEQCAVDMSVNPSTGALTQADYFEPYEYDSLNGGDRDFGSSGIALLDPVTFSGGGVKRVAIAGGKSGKVYILNADNLGGFAEGAGGADNVLQTIVNANSLLSGAGSYPLEGGYVYINPTADVVYAYKMGYSSQGTPYFTLAGKSLNKFAGTSVPTVTSLNGQPGTGIVWLSDTNLGLVAFHAVPVNGVLQQITPLPAVGGTTKYQRVAFGNGRAYLSVHSIVVAVGGGTAVTPPLKCTPNPVAFGSVTVGASAPLTVSCTAGTAAITMKYCTTNLAVFSCLNSSLPTTVAAGATFTFPVTMSLTPAILQYTRDHQGTQVVPGNVASLLNLYYAVGTGPSTEFSLSLSGTAVASTGYLAANLQTVDFGGVVLGSATQTSLQTIILSNDGKTALTFTGFAWQNPLAAPMTYTNITVATTSNIGKYFTATGFPAVGSTIAAGASITISMTFSPLVSGSASSLLSFWSNGGFIDAMLTGSASGAYVSSSSSSVHSTTFSASKASTLSTVTTSKSSTSTSTPSRSSASSTKSSSQTTSASSTSKSISSITTSSVSSATTSATVSSISSTTSSSGPASTLNPLEPASVGGFDYIGCYYDNTGVTPVRSLAYNILINPLMTLEMCAQNCAGYEFFGTEYSDECYCGYTLSTSLKAPETDCTSYCSGNGAELCGTNNRLSVYQSSTYIPPLPAPSHVPQVGGYTWQGCYTESTTGRALTGPSFSGTMTVEACQTFCTGYSYFGVEYARECYCGNSLSAGSVNTTVSRCSMTCTANSLEYCGGSSVLDMYYL